MAKKTRPSRDAQSTGDDKNMGQALRSVYEETVNEDIPAEMLDLLGKLE